MKHAVIVEFGGNHSETIGFYLKGLKGLDYKVSIYFAGGSIPESYIIDLLEIEQFSVIHYFSDLLDITSRGKIDFAVINSARNLKVGASNAVKFFKLLLENIDENHIIIQGHAEYDFDLDFVRSFNSHKTAATPLLAHKADSYFIPYYDGIYPLAHALRHNGEKTPIQIIKMGGVNSHSKGQFCADKLLKVLSSAAAIDLIIYGKGKIENDEITDLLKLPNCRLLPSTHATMVARQSTLYRTFNWVINTTNGIYTSRILTGALPFSVNYGVPPIIDAKTAEIYGIEDDRLIFDTSLEMDLDRINNIDARSYKEIFSDWQETRRNLISTELNRFLEFFSKIGYAN